jgi:hypothetical protein
MPSGDGPMDEHRFSRSQQTRTRACAEIMLNNSWSAMVIHPEPVALWRDYLAYRDLISRHRAARSPVKASRCSSIGQALPR